MKGVVLVLLALAVAAPAFAAGGSKEPTKRHTAADMRLARSIALRLADFAAGWKQEKGGTSSSGGNADCAGYPDESKLIETGGVDPSFDSPNGGAVTVDSEVDVYATKAMALVDWGHGNLKVLRACFAELLTKTTGKHVVVTASAAPVPARAERRLGMRFEATWNGVSFDIDLIALGKGRTTVFLSADGPKGAYSRSMLAPFARVLAQRLSKSAS